MLKRRPRLRRVSRRFRRRSSRVFFLTCEIKKRLPPGSLFSFGGNNTLVKSERSPLLARRGGCGEATDGVVDQVPKISRQEEDAQTNGSTQDLNHHPGASRHPSWPEGAILERVPYVQGRISFAVCHAFSDLPTMLLPSQRVGGPRQRAG